jgi:integrase
MALKLGLREQELMFAEWTDVNWQDSTFRVQGKQHWEFKVKDSEQREVPIPADLLERLREWRRTRPKSKLIVGTASDKPNGHFLRALKRLAKREGLNCGSCGGCRGTGDCQQWTLHKLRRTYATTLLRNGVDVRTVQAYAGHADMETTLRYLRPASAAEAQERINAIQWGEASRSNEP